MIHPVILKPNIGGGNGLLNNLIGAWLFDETSGTTVNDSAGTNNGTNYGATINQTGKLNKCYSFDGVDDYVTFATPSPFVEDFPNDFTVAFWLNLVEVLTYKRYLEIDGSSVNFVVSGNFSNNILVRFYSTNIDLKLRINSGLSSDTWYHVAITWDASTSTWKLYLNGSDLGVTSSDYVGVGYGTEMCVGAIAGSHGSLSKIKFDQLLIYNAVLTQEQITTLSGGLFFSQFTN